MADRGWDLRESAAWEVVHRCCSLSIDAHRAAASRFKVTQLPRPANSAAASSAACAVFAFAGSWSADDWLSEEVSDPFGAAEVDLGLFPSLMSIVDGKPAVVNAGFLRCFRRILHDSAFLAEVDKALSLERRIIFTGHSSGGSLSALAAIWLLERLKRHGGQFFPACVTFGSPLVGDHVFSYSLIREGWSHHFLNFVMTFDIVPRVFFTSFQSSKKELQEMLHVLFSGASAFSLNSAGISVLSSFYTMVLRNSQIVASKRACMLMRCTNPLLETFTAFTKLSPYRPFGAYVFCTRETRLLALRNSEAVLQLLFYLFQPSYEDEVAEVACRSLQEHLIYETEMQKIFKMRDLVYLDTPEAVPLLPCDATMGKMQSLGTLLRDLSLSTEARLCLRAAGEQEKQMQLNCTAVDSNSTKIKDLLRSLTKYQERCRSQGLGYYDTFKLRKNTEEDFQANVCRIKLAGLWDGIVEMLKWSELPGELESREDWVKLGTEYRRLVEPLDIANYYRLEKNADTGAYMSRGRPSRYKYTQALLEYKQPAYRSLESCFWAEVEELRIAIKDGGHYTEMKEAIMTLEERVEAWHSMGVLSGDAYLGESTFVKWWKSLPEEHRLMSRLGRYMN